MGSEIRCVEPAGHRVTQHPCSRSAVLVDAAARALSRDHEDASPPLLARAGDERRKGLASLAPAHPMQIELHFHREQSAPKADEKTPINTRSRSGHESRWFGCRYRLEGPRPGPVRPRCADGSFICRRVLSGLPGDRRTVFAPPDRLRVTHRLTPQPCLFRGRFAAGLDGFSSLRLSASGHLRRSEGCARAGARVRPAGRSALYRRCATAR